MVVLYEVAYLAGSEEMAWRAADIAKIQRLTDYRPGLDLWEML